jgi:hypothetical protein
MMEELPVGWAAAISQALTRFRFTEAAAVARLAADDPIAFEYAELLETYHHFMMQSHPAATRSGAPAPFGLVRDGFNSIAEERKRIQAVWLDGWAKTPPRNLFVFAYWATCQSDGIRSTMWLKRLFDHLNGSRSEVASILQQQQQGYLGGEPVERAIDVYVALEMARHAMEQDARWPSPDQFLSSYLPTNLMAEMGP